MSNVVFFEICVDDLEAAAGFYSQVFGWEIEQGEEGSDSWSISTGDEDALPGALTLRFDELNPTINTVEVDSLDDCAKAITELGGKVLAPQVPIAGVGYVQYCHDPEGNAFAILEYDESVT